MNFTSEPNQLIGTPIAYPGVRIGSIGIEKERGTPLPVNGLLKRTVDFLITLMLVLISLPAFLLTALLVRLDSPGPIFYSQQRLGKGGRKILIYKFRSMHEDADHILAEYLNNHPAARLEWGQTQKLRSDPRITAVGKWIRESSLDELPQLFNILKGDMSLVGPRPILPEQEEMYGPGINLYREVRPGLTGFWQVSGRNHTTFVRRTAYDAYYVTNWSIWLDISIVVRTIWIVLSRDGAY